MTRLYTDKELGALIKRATELQDEAASSAQTGLSLAEIEGLAAELGIEAEHLHAAAADLDRGSVVRPGFHLLGGPFRTELRRVVEGELTDELWEEVVHELRSWSGGVGRVSEMGRSREWMRAKADIGHAHVALSPSEGKTTIRMRDSFVTGAGLSYFMTAMFGGLAMGAALEASGLPDLALIGVWLMGVATALTGTRFVLSYLARRQRRRLAALMQRVAGLLHSSRSNEAPDPLAGEHRARTREPSERTGPRQAGRAKT